MSASPLTPKVARGALVGVDAFNPVASLVVFQYNPDQLTRTLTPQYSGGGTASAGGGADPVRLSGPPQESVRLEIQFEATDRLEADRPGAMDNGVLPQLSALEMLLYPKTAKVIADEVLIRAGLIEVVPPEAPLTLLVWGARRVLPVRITEFTVTEQMFGPGLVPIHAKVALGLRVLNYRDLGVLSPGGALFLAHQVAKEALATLNASDGLPALAGLPGI
jgi:hypothetical protein